MKLVILAAGGHRRLPSLTVPKALIRFNGLTITEMVIRDFVRVGVTEVAICIGYKGGTITRFIGDYCLAPVRYFRNDDWATTGAAYSLKMASGFFAGEDCVIMEGDHLLHPALPRKLMEHVSPNAILVDTKSKPELMEETVVCGEDGVVDNLVWPAYQAAGNIVGEAIVMVKLCSCNSRLLASVLGNGEVVEPLDYVARCGHTIDYVETDLPWIEIDTPEDLKRARYIYNEIREARNE
jgi:choline kinase